MGIVLSLDKVSRLCVKNVDQSQETRLWRQLYDELLIAKSEQSASGTNLFGASNPST
jgi:hypothetical protein